MCHHAMWTGRLRLSDTARDAAAAARGYVTSLPDTAAAQRRCITSVRIRCVLTSHCSY